MRDFSDDNARDPVIVALLVSHFVEHVVGSVERPLSDAALEAKALGAGNRGPSGRKAPGRLPHFRCLVQ